MAENTTLWSGEFLRQLGIKGGRLLGVDFSIQPAVICQDARQLFAPLHANAAYYGGSFTQDGSGTDAIAVDAVAKGGVIVEEINISFSLATMFHGHLALRVTGDWPGGAVVPFTPMGIESITEVPPNCVCSFFTHIGGFAADLPKFEGLPVNNKLFYDREIYIPAGHSLYMLTEATVQMLCEIRVREVPAAPGAA